MNAAEAAVDTRISRLASDRALLLTAGLALLASFGSVFLLSNPEGVDHETVTGAEAQKFLVETLSQRELGRAGAVLTIVFVGVTLSALVPLIRRRAGDGLLPLMALLGGGLMLVEFAMWGATTAVAVVAEDLDKASPDAALVWLQFEKFGESFGDLIGGGRFLLVLALTLTPGLLHRPIRVLTGILAVAFVGQVAAFVLGQEDVAVMFLVIGTLGFALAMLTMGVSLLVKARNA